MKTVNTKLIFDFLKENKMSKTEFCTKSCISMQSLNSFLNNKNVQIKTILKIREIVGCDLLQLIYV
ncbi:MAG: helix-turn-helix domain-containing protein [Clostridiales bacterium]|nr:helix-turn-helix domain-containing protein [Clostridiales bacterium]